MSQNFLNIFLLVTVLAVPPLIIGVWWMRTKSTMTVLPEVLALWFTFLVITLLFRALIGTILFFSDESLAGVAAFYPVRIAYPNWDILRGIPYVAACLAILVWLPIIIHKIRESRFRYPLLWFLGVILLTVFGAIHGGIITGNIGVSNSETHLHDAALNDSVSETFSTHIDRIKGLAGPPYEAPHSTSHPAWSVAYWQLLVPITTPFIFSLLNVLLFSLSLPMMFWALRRPFGEEISLQTALFAAVTPGILIYGRSDDAIYYGLTAMIIALLAVALRSNRYRFSTGAGVLFIGAMNFSYASVTLFPAAFSFFAEAPIKNLPAYLIKNLAHMLVVAALSICGAIIVWELTDFNFFEGFLVSAEFNRPTTIWAHIDNGKYLRAINDRLMAIFDFLIFGGPVLLYLLVTLVQRLSPEVGIWRIKNVALTVLLLMLAVNSNGSGEVARPWGSLYILIFFCWIPHFLNKYSDKERWRLIKLQLGWAVLLQTILHFGW
jgi:hypothetical protein